MVKETKFGLVLAIVVVVITLFTLTTMFGFSKTGRLVADYPDTWTLSQGIHEGKPLFIRSKEGLLEAQDLNKYPFQIGIAVPLLNPTSEGLTTDEEADTLWNLEDSLATALAQNGEAVFVASITTNGMREFVFYAKEWKPEYFEQKVNEVFVGSEHGPQFMMQPDKNWDTYKGFVR